MKNAVCNQVPATEVRGNSKLPSVVTTLDQARRVYLQSESRLDLATLARAFADAPESVEVSGKMPKPPLK